MIDPSVPSLRERSKAKRRVAIQRAAMRLFAEHGYDGATIADIAEEAELAPRTVTLYFPSKIDIAMSVSSDMAARLTSVFTDNPELSFTDALEVWLLGEGAANDHELLRLTGAMFDANPSLRAVSTAQLTDAVSIAGPAFLDELGLPAEHPMVGIVSAAVGAIIGQYLVNVAAADEPNNERHEDVMRYLRAVITAGRVDGSSRKRRRES